jgi:hypothetical protein
LILQKRRGQNELEDPTKIQIESTSIEEEDRRWPTTEKGAAVVVQARACGITNSWHLDPWGWMRIGGGLSYKVREGWLAMI